jgi:segregation and condensation protein B
MRQKRKERARIAREQAEVPDDAEAETPVEEPVAEEAVAEALAVEVEEEAAASDPAEDVAAPEEDVAASEEDVAASEEDVAASAEDVAVEEDASGEADADEVADAAPGTAELDPARFKSLIEALVFASDKPVTLLRLKQLTRIKDVARIQAALDELVADYKDRGVGLQGISGGYMFRTQSAYSGWVQQLIAGRPVRLSRAQLETLAIIAYRQPITRPEIDDIRGVDSGGTLKVLLDRNLIRILGKKEEAGRPLLYGTTKEFLDFFSLGDLRELPTLREYSELSDEHRRVVDEEHGEEPEPEVQAEAKAPVEAEAMVEAVAEAEPEAVAEPEADAEPVANPDSDESAA